MKWGWIDLVASIPTLEILRLGRLVRIFRVLRMLRGMRLAHRILTTVFRNKIKGGATVALLSVFLIICFSSVSILVCEKDPESNIKTADDALWWSITTLSTVGYGDRYPVTTEGRVVACVLMLSGLGLFGTISALTASLFVGLPEETDSTKELNEEVQRLRAEIVTLRNSLPPFPIARE